jgi:hypothetical protein
MFFGSDLQFLFLEDLLVRKSSRGAERPG